MPHPSALPRTPRRAVAMLAAAVCSTSLIATLLVGFDRQSPRTWLQPAPALLGDLKACDRRADRAARLDCQQVVVAQHRRPLPVRMAANP